MDNILFNLSKANDWFSNNCQECLLKDNCIYEDLIENYIETLNIDKKLENIDFQEDFNFNCKLKKPK